MSILRVRPRIRLGMFTVLMMGMVMLVASLMAVTTMLDIRRVHSFSKDQLEERGFLLANALNDVLADALYFLDIDKLNDLAELIRGQPDVVDVQVFEPSGDLIVDPSVHYYAVGKVRHEFALESVGSRRMISRLEGRIMHVTAPITSGDDVIGGIHFTLANDRTEAATRRITVEKLWQSAVLLVVAVAASYVMARRFVRPITQLALSTEAIAMGEFRVPIAYRRDDEIGDLTVALAEMSRELGESRVELESRATELSGANEQLLREMSERKELEAQLLQSQKMEAVGRLAGGVAHDFNNLLTAILGYAQLGAKEAAADGRLGVALQEITRAGERAADLTRQLLAFSRRQIIEPQIVDLNDLILKLDGMLRRLIGENIELITVPGADMPVVKVDPGQVEQVIVNLAVNARDAMPQGGALTIETARVTLGESYASQNPEALPGEYVVIAVSDNGVGIASDIKARIFEPFFTTKERGKGTGLGLSTCYGIVKQNGGHISVYSEPGQGATFKVYLPSIGERPSLDQALSEEDDLLTGSETVLLVEDEPSVRQLATSALRTYGYSVLEAADGQQALKLAKARTGTDIHLLVTDVVMPAMGGRELVDGLVAIHPETKVLYMSGYTDDAIVHHGVLEEGTEFLQKPFTPVTLGRRVREILDDTRRGSASQGPLSP